MIKTHTLALQASTLLFRIVYRVPVLVDVFEVLEGACRKDRV